MSGSEERARETDCSKDCQRALARLLHSYVFPPWGTRRRLPASLQEMREASWTGAACCDYNGGMSRHRFLHSTYRLHDVDHGRSLTEMLEMHYIEITKFSKDKPYALRTPFEKWLHVLKFAEVYEAGLEPLPEVLESEEGIAMALDAMRRAWSTDDVREMIELREKALHDEATRFRAKLLEAARKLLAQGVDRETVLRSLELPLDTAL